MYGFRFFLPFGSERKKIQRKITERRFFKQLKNNFKTTFKKFNNHCTNRPEKLALATWAAYPAQYNNIGQQLHVIPNLKWENSNKWKLKALI